MVFLCKIVDAKRPTIRLKDVSYLSLGRITDHATSVISYVVLPRYFGPEAIGAYFFALGLAGLFAILAEFGLNTLTLQEIDLRHLPTQRGVIVGRGHRCFQSE